MIPIFVMKVPVGNRTKSVIDFIWTGEMPSIFKALASISAWVLFVFGLFSLVITFVFMNVAQAQIGYSEPPPIQPYFGLGLGVASIVSSVVTMKLRHMLE